MMMTQTNRMTQMKRLRKREEPLRKQNLPQSHCLSQSNLKSKSRPQWLLRRLFLKFSSRLYRKWTLYLIFLQVSPQLPSHNSNLCNRLTNLTLDFYSSRSNKFIRHNSSLRCLAALTSPNKFNLFSNSQISALSIFKANLSRLRIPLGFKTILNNNSNLSNKL